LRLHVHSPDEAVAGNFSANHSALRLAAFPTPNGSMLHHGCRDQHDHQRDSANSQDTDE